LILALDLLTVILSAAKDLDRSNGGDPSLRSG
jgi:hypothetical protein